MSVEVGFQVLETACETDSKTFSILSKSRGNGGWRERIELWWIMENEVGGRFLHMERLDLSVSYRGSGVLMASGGEGGYNPPVSPAYG